MARKIFLSGHGGWEPSQGYTKLPKGCKIHFYTHFAKNMMTGMEHQPRFLQSGKHRVAAIHGPTKGQGIERADHHCGKNLGGKFGSHITRFQAGDEQLLKALYRRHPYQALLILVEGEGQGSH